ncbi:MAG: hypothetical protein GVY10_00235 [Verrucomicrobia bacterium]|jgi:hypothetical protein|nr:hypothetical protein [Verrucomicrobiota bacterium]
MATKTITLELDAYERLKQAKRGKESFSAVVRRARFDDESSSGASILEATAGLYEAGKGVPAKTIQYWDEAVRRSEASARISPSAWEG